MVTQQHSVYAPPHYSTDCGSIIYIGGERLVCFYIVSWCTLSRIREGRLVCFYVVRLLVYSEHDPGGEGLSVLCSFSSGALRRVYPRKTTTPCLDSIITLTSSLTRERLSVTNLSSEKNFGKSSLTIHPTFIYSYIIYIHLQISCICAAV